MEEKIKVIEFTITDGRTYLFKTDDSIAPIKLFRLKQAIQDYINRPLYSIDECGIEYIFADGKTLYVTKEDLDKLFRAVYPQYFEPPISIPQ